MPFFWLRGVKKELCLSVSFLIVSAGFLILSASAIRLLADSLIVSVNILILLFREKGSARGICMNVRRCSPSSVRKSRTFVDRNKKPLTPSEHLLLEVVCIIRRRNKTALS